MKRDNELKTALAALPRPKRLLVAEIVKSLSRPSHYSVNDHSGLFNDEFGAGFEGILQIHHAVSDAPFTKDKFEWGMVHACKGCGMTARQGPRGLAGFDIEVNDEKWSLKTQADRKIRLDHLHISKFMELGKGKWENESDLAGLRDRMLTHMEGYDRIFSLRHFKQEDGQVSVPHFYELVEIPKTLLAQAADGVIEMKQNSPQTPKPGYCTVEGKFQLYFDGGSERKLQIKRLMKEHCIVHVTWTID